MVNEAVYKSRDDSFGRSTARRDGKSISKVNIYCSKNKLLPLQLWEQFSITNLPPFSWLITPKNDAISRIQCQALLMTDWALSSGHSQAGLDEWKSVA